MDSFSGVNTRPVPESLQKIYDELVAGIADIIIRESKQNTASPISEATQKRWADEQLGCRKVEKDT